jgi:Asp-tRNA(Asn)/Glu-tRNA(Gln) amidotransferase C subunit
VPTCAEVLAVARLARLSFAADEVDRLASELTAILRHADALRTVVEEAAAASSMEGTPSVPADMASSSDPVARGPENPPLRADAPGADPLRLPPARLASDWRDGFFTVPRLRTHDDAQ